MDLTPIFRAKFPFWGGLGGIRASTPWARFRSLNNSVYQRVLAAAALPLRGIVTAGGWEVCDGGHRLIVMKDPEECGGARTRRFDVCDGAHWAFVMKKSQRPRPSLCDRTGHPPAKNADTRTGHPFDLPRLTFPIAEE